MASSGPRRGRITFLHRLEYIGWLTITALLRLVPRRGMIIFADAAGWALYHVFKLRRDVIDSQLQASLGHDSGHNLTTIGCRSWQNAVLTFFEFVQPDPIGSAGWDDYPDRIGFEQNAKPLIDGNQAGIILTAHIGNWESLGRLAQNVGVPVAAVAKPMHNQLVNNSILKSRARHGFEVLEIKRTMKAIPDALRSGKWVAILGDQDARRRGIFVNFFGRPASTAPGAARFARMLNCPVLPAFSVRSDTPDRQLKVIFAEPIWPDLDADPDSDVLRITQEHTSALEDVIRQYPADYFWLHRRWKTQPKKPKT